MENDQTVEHQLRKQGIDQAVIIIGLRERIAELEADLAFEKETAGYAINALSETLEELEAELAKTKEGLSIAVEVIGNTNIRHITGEHVKAVEALNQLLSSIPMPEPPEVTE